MRRSLVTAGVAVAIVGATGAGWTAASRVKSPAKLAAETAPPVASLITFPVEKRILSSDLILRGTVRYSDPITVVLASSLLKPATVLVSTPPTKGSTIKEGDVALVVSGRPVLALTGAAPMYRDLGPGMTGEDVGQLKAALVRLGFNPGTAGTAYDGATSNAVAAWYTKAGFSAFGPNDVQRNNVRSAESAVSQATDRVLQARQNLLVAPQGVKPVDIADANAAIAVAESGIVSAQSVSDRDAARGRADIAARESTIRASTFAVDEAKRRAALSAAGVNSSTGLGVSPGQVALLEQGIADANAGLAAAETDLAASQATADTIRKSGDTLVADAKGRVASAGVFIGPISAQQNLDLATASSSARSALTSVESAAAKDNSVAAAELALKSNAVVAARSKVAQAEGRLQTLRGGVDPATGIPFVTPGDQASAAASVQQGEIALAAAQSDLDATKRTVELTAVANQQAIADARLRLQSAQTRLAALNVPSLSTKTLSQAISLAEAELTRLKSELGKVIATVGVQVPANEVVFFPSLPLRIDDTKLKRGDPANADVMTVSGTHLAIDSSLLTTEAALTKIDAPVTVESPEYAFTTKGHISFVADRPGLRGTDAQHIAIEVVPNDAPAQLVGASVKLTIPTKTTEGEALIVPVGALSVRADGTTQLQVQDKPGVVRSVTVTPGLSAQGFVAITPTKGALAVGDRVVIASSGPSSAVTSSTTPVASVAAVPSSRVTSAP